MAENECHWCELNSPNLKTCSGCRKIRYCSSRCQTQHWPLHIFDCQPGKPISTVYHLARAMRRDVIPVDHQTRIDYGFEKAEKMLGENSQNMLCGLYQGLLNVLEVPAQELRKWQRSGRLIEGIKTSFEKIPATNRGAYYPWFLEHQFLLDGTHADEALHAENSKRTFEDMLKKGWVFTGGSPEDSTEEIQAALEKLPSRKRECHHMYARLLSRFRPAPFEDAWVSFGFVACPDSGAEMWYTRQYITLIERCTFDEFCTAYETSSMSSLFNRYGLSMEREKCILDVLSGSPVSYKSVWYLKKYVDVFIASTPDDRPQPERSVACDYGFGNCRDSSEQKLLDDMYVHLFTNKGIDPLEMHEACIKGELVPYVKRFMKLAPLTAKYTRLLKNPYPLPDLEGLRIVPTRT